MMKYEVRKYTTFYFSGFLSPPTVIVKIKVVRWWRLAVLLCRLHDFFRGGFIPGGAIFVARRSAVRIVERA